MQYNIIKEINQDAGSTGRKRGIMNTREELAKIIDLISGALDRYSTKELPYKAGAYEVTLQSVKKDLEIINEILEIKENRI